MPLPKDPEFDVRAEGSTLLNVKFHDSISTPRSHTGRDSNSHPWSSLLNLEDSKKTLNSSDDIISSPAHRVALNTDTATSSNPINDDDLTTQGLLDGLDAFCDQEEATTETATPEIEPLGDVDAAEANELLEESGCFTNAKVKTKAQTAEQAFVDELEDMADDEAIRIIAKYGGFLSNSNGKLPNNRSQQSRNPQKDIKSLTGEMEDADLAKLALPDMEKEVAHHIVQSLGGFTKPQATRLPAVSMAMVNGDNDEPGRAIKKLKLQEDALTLTTTAATTSIEKDAHLGSIVNGQFPSRKDVLMARRALKQDSPRIAKIQHELGSPKGTLGYNTGAKTLTTNKSPLLSTNGNTTVHAKQLSFKSPNLKRLLTRSPFRSPSKRVSTGENVGISDLLSDTTDDTRHQLATKRCLKPSHTKPFRSPARVTSSLGDESSPSKGSSARNILNRTRPPPKLPPVSTPRKQKGKESTYQPVVFDLNQELPTPRHTLSSISSQINIHNKEGLSQCILSMTSGLATQYRFQLPGSDITWGYQEARQVLIARGCNSGVLTAEWIQNHYKWVVWSCACYARRLPAQRDAFWSIEAVINRLLYRYEREYACGQRSALRRILEGDSPAQQLMVLCVSEIHSIQSQKGVRVLVTDGWYQVLATVDAVLYKAIRANRLRIGDKIACAGIRMDGLTEGVSPLSSRAENEAILSLNANCVRRAAWDAKLGFQRSKAMFLSISAINQLGGPIGAALDVVAVRKYPMTYMEKLPNGQRVMRSEKEEQRVAAAFEDSRRAKVSALQEELELRRQNIKSRKLLKPSVSQCMDGEELFDFVLSGNADQEETRRGLTNTQIEEVSRYAEERKIEDVTKVMEAAEMQFPVRQVSSLAKLLVCDYPAHKYKHCDSQDDMRYALVTMWNPHYAVLANFQEGSRYILTGTTTAAVANNNTETTTGGYQQQHPRHVRINFNTKGSRYQKMAFEPSFIQQSGYHERGSLHIDELRHVTVGQEVDVVGTVTKTSDGSKGGDCNRHHSNQLLPVIWLTSTDEGGKEHTASIEYSAITFGTISPDFGSQVTVRNCKYASAVSSENYDVFYLTCDSNTEFLW